MRRRNQSYASLVHSNPEHQDVFIVNWMLGNTCNYSCSYCPSYLHDGSHAWINIEQAIDFCKKLILHYHSKKIVMEFTGGEVTMWKDFLTLCRFLHEENVRISVISNGSRTERWWKEALPYLDRVNLSFHPQSADSLHFISIVELLHQSVHTHVNIMMLPSHFDSCHQLAQEISDTFSVSVSMQPLLYNLKGQIYPYSTAQLDILNKTVLSPSVPSLLQADHYRGEMVKAYTDGKRESYPCHHYISSFENNWRGWSCMAGMEQLVIAQDGNVYRGWCMNGGIIGNIADRQIRFPIHAVYCSSSSCSCNFDILCTKHR
jgi:sulfatase maturation enzyme AslB (radical SAM superfamily)